MKCLLSHALLLALSTSAAAQAPSTVRVLVLRDSAPVPGALVRLPGIVQRTDSTGRATIQTAPGSLTLVVTRIGLVPDTVRLVTRAEQDTSLTVSLREQAEELESVVIGATRAERRVDDTPLRVEVVDAEEVAEKVAMTPGDIVMMLNETSGLRVQTTSPSLGGAGLRIQGLASRHSLILADGLPLYGQAGGLGLLQIPPMDLGRAEIIKGSASALYGTAALGGVVNLVSRRPGIDHIAETLINQTTRGGSDAVFFGATPYSASGWGATLLGSGHRQSRSDVNADGWADIPYYLRGVARPRVFFDDGAGRSFFATLGFTREDRTGGTLPGRTLSNGEERVEGLGTTRLDAGIVARTLVAERNVVSMRASAAWQIHTHQLGGVDESDWHRTYLVEGSAALPRGRTTTVLGVAYQREAYLNSDVRGFNYHYDIPGVFAQMDVDAREWLLLSASARVDRHSVYGTSLSPRVSALLRASNGWTSRLSAGGGSVAPTPFTDETEATGLTPVVPLESLQSERAVTASWDVNGPLELSVGRLELNATVFGSRVSHPLETVEGNFALRIVNAPLPARTVGTELLARWLYEHARVTATYAYTRATAWDPERGGDARADVPLTPRHTAGLVASIEKEEESRVGLELYYTGSQRLRDNPYRSTSKPYVVLGLLGERWFGRTRVFLNAENLLDVRQTRVDPLLRTTPGAGGRWTTDVWSFLDGRTLNAGVRASF